MIHVEKHGADRGPFSGLAEIILDRPEKRNSLTPEMIEQINLRAGEIAADPSVKAILLRGEGSVFCAGFDLSLCRDNSEALKRMLIALSTAMRTLRRIEKPVVMAAHGAAIAGGCALLAGADLVVTNLEAKLGYPVVRLGISPAVNAPMFRLAVGDRACRVRMLDSSLISGEEAKRIGLAGICVGIPEDVIPRAQIEAMKLAGKPPQAFAATKRWLNEIEGSDRDEAMDEALRASMSLVGGAEERERLAMLWS